MKNRWKALPFIFVVVAIIGIFSSAASPNPAAAAPMGGDDDPDPEPAIEPELQAQFMAEGEAGYMIQFRHRPNLSLAYQLDWETRGRFVANSLQTSADKSQLRVRAYLDAKGVDYKPFWIQNVILVNISNRETFDGLMSFIEVDSLRSRRQPMLHEPVEIMPVQRNPAAGVEMNLQHVGADQVWGMGYTGEGIVVANIDTGVRYTHQALLNQYRGNLGDGNFNHNYNWWDPELGGSDPIPNDWHGHGSHTMGIILGDDGQGNHTGMAPGATWMACQAFEGNDSELLECGQFLLAPWDLNGENPDPTRRPHVINNSWGDCVQYLDTWYLGMVESWLAAGIYPVFSNGNTSSCGYSEPPGLNTVSNPARYGNVTGVGSTGKNDGQYATHSNWGPTDSPDVLNPNEYPNIKPQVVAPGVRILSAFNSGDADYREMSGTSMSAPHVTGLVALMWDAAPCLIGEYAATETIIQATANPVSYDDGSGNGAVTPNNATGWGEINAASAVQTAKDYCNADFRIDAGPEVQSVCAPNDVLYDVNVGEVMGFDEAVTLNVISPPPGAGINFNPNPATPPTSSVLTISTADVTAAGIYEMEVIGISGQQTHTDTVTLNLYVGIPQPPSIVAPVDGADTVSVTPTFRWELSEQAAYYRLEIATDAAFNQIVYSAEVTETSHTIPDWLEHNRQYHWRVTAANTCGDSTTSTASFETSTPASILLVDDDDNKPDVSEYYTDSLDALGYGYDVWDTWNSDDEPDAAHLAAYEIVIWFVGDEWEAPAGPGTEAESALAAWLDSGKCLLLSGQDYLWNRGVDSFVREYLGVDDFDSDITQTSVTGVGDVLDGLGPYALEYPYYNFSDGLAATASASVALSGNKGNAGLMVDNGIYKTTFWAFPFEAIPSLNDRGELMNATLEWCGVDTETFDVYLPLIER
ncbi:MAG: S8 family serine peptidase [Chloroflexota bacterium]|nr:S8 family serine peptidase [Chloroflexota bacterium]